MFTFARVAADRRFPEMQQWALKLDFRQSEVVALVIRLQTIKTFNPLILSIVARAKNAAKYPVVYINRNGGWFNHCPSVTVFATVEVTNPLAFPAETVAAARDPVAV